MSLLLYYIQESGAIAGTAAGVADSSAILLGSGAASSSVSCAGSVGAPVLLGNGGISCTASGLTVLSASGTASAAISGSSSGVASQSVSIRGSFPLVGSITGLSSASASIGEQGDELSGSIGCTSSVVGSIIASGALSAVSAGVGSAVEVSFVDGSAFGISFVEASIFVRPNAVNSGHSSSPGNILKMRASVDTMAGTATLTGIRTQADVDSISTKAVL